MTWRRRVLCLAVLCVVGCDVVRATAPPSDEGRMLLSGDVDALAGFTAVVEATGIVPGRAGAVFALGTVTFESTDTSIARVLSTTEVGNFNQRFEARVVTRRQGVVDILVSSTRAGTETWKLTVRPCPEC